MVTSRFKIIRHALKKIIVGFVISAYSPYIYSTLQLALIIVEKILLIYCEHWYWISPVHFLRLPYDKWRFNFDISLKVISACSLFCKSRWDAWVFLLAMIFSHHFISDFILLTRRLHFLSLSIRSRLNAGAHFIYASIGQYSNIFSQKYLHSRYLIFNSFYQYNIWYFYTWRKELMLSFRSS